MKRTSRKNKRERGLARGLELVRITVRELTPTQMGQIQGGDGEPWTCIPGWTRITDDCV
jgi:hypothetical protein